MSASGSEFSVGAELSLSIANGQLSSLRSQIENELSDIPVGVDASGVGGGSRMQPRDPATGQFMSIEGVEQRIVEQTGAQVSVLEDINAAVGEFRAGDAEERSKSVTAIQTEIMRRTLTAQKASADFDELRNEILEDIKDAVEGGGIGLGGGGAGGGGTNIIPIGGLGATGALGGAAGAVGGAGALAAAPFLFGGLTLGALSQDEQLKRRLRRQREQGQRDIPEGAPGTAGTGVGRVEAPEEPDWWRNPPTVQVKGGGRAGDISSSEAARAALRGAFINDANRNRLSGGGRASSISSADIDEIIRGVQEAQQPEVTVEHRPVSNVNIESRVDEIVDDVRSEVESDRQDDLDDLERRVRKALGDRSGI